MKLEGLTIQLELDDVQHAVAVGTMEHCKYNSIEVRVSDNTMLVQVWFDVENILNKPVYNYIQQLTLAIGDKFKII